MRSRFALSILALMLLVLAALPAHAGNPCGAQLHDGGTRGGEVPVANEGGIGGTGRPAAMEGGIGGTGRIAGEGGIGGTGQVAGEGGIGGTGIVGVITGFGSICVNGIEVHYDGATPMTDGGQPMKASELAVGHVVAVEAVGRGDSVVARRVERIHSVVGPIGRFDAVGRRVELLGQRVQVPALHWNAVEQAARTGEPVRVSGLRLASGEIRATRIDPAGAGAQSRVSGPVTRLVPGGFEIEGLRVVPPGSGLKDIAVGREVVVQGEFEGGRMRASAIEVRPQLPFGGRSERVVLEGFVINRNLDRVRVGSTDVRLDRGTTVSRGELKDVRQGERLVVTARIEGQRVVAERIEMLRDRPGRLEDGDARGPSGRGASGDSKSRDREDHSGHGGGDDDASQADRIDNSGHGSVERADRSGSSDRVERVERVDRSGPSDRPENASNGSSGRTGRTGRTRGPQRAIRPPGTRRAPTVMRCWRNADTSLFQLTRGDNK